MKLTKPQAAALQKFVDHGGPAHQKLLKINEGVFDHLWDMGCIKFCGFMVKYPSEKGLAALAEYHAKNKSAQETSQ